MWRFSIDDYDNCFPNMMPTIFKVSLDLQKKIVQQGDPKWMLLFVQVRWWQYWPMGKLQRFVFEKY